MDERLRTLVRTVQVRFPWIPDLKASGQRAVRQALRRPFEDDFRALRQLGLPAGSRCLDVGANRGQSIDAIRLCADSPVIDAFEPNGLLAARLQRRFARDPSVTVRNVALGDEPGTFTLHVPSYRGYVFDGLASLDEDEARGWLRGRVLGYDERHLRVEAVRCEVVRLDDLGLDPAFVKLDVQGFEAHVLRGGTATIARCRPVLLVETPVPEVRDVLDGLGYRPHGYTGGRLVPDREGTLNTFFLP